MDRHHDPRRNQLAVEWPVGICDLPVPSQPASQQFSGGFRQVTRVWRIEPFALNPVTSAGTNGGVSFATMGNSEPGGGSRIYYFGPPPR